MMVPPSGFVCDSSLDQLHGSPARVVDRKGHMLPGLEGLEMLDLRAKLTFGPRRIDPFSNNADHHEQQNG